MPKLWTETIAEHREAVHEAVLNAAASLISERGLPSLTMAAIAEATGIGRATLYKHFTNVTAVLEAWHERHIASHVSRFEAACGSTAGAPMVRLNAAAAAYAELAHAGPAGDIGTLLHASSHAAHAKRRMAATLAGLIQEAAGSGDVRRDVPPAELAAFVVAALANAGDLRPAQRKRLIEVTLAGLRRARTSD